MSQEYPLHFISGQHSDLPDPMMDVQLRVMAGDLSAHYWNPEVAQRIRSIKPAAPRIIGLDSVYASYIPGKITADWTWLPGSPQELSGRDSIFVVGGDLLHQELIDFDFDSPMYSDLDALGWNEVTEYLHQSLWENGVTIGLGLLAASYSLIRDDDGQRRQIYARGLQPGITRRGLLKKAASLVGITAGALTLGRLAPIVEFMQTDDQASELLQELGGITKPFFANSTWLDARTALVITKTQESMRRLGLPFDTTGAVVMGWPHGYNATKLMTNPQERIRLIEAYAIQLYGSILPTLKRLGYVQTKEIERSDFELTLELLALTDIYNISQPDRKSVSDFGVDEYIRENYTQKILQFQSPAIVAGLSNLKEHYPF